MDAGINPFLLYFIFCEGIWGFAWLPVRILLPTTLGSTFLLCHCISYCCLLLRVGSNNRLTYNRLGILIICRNLIFSGHLLQPEGGHKLPVTGILLLTYDTWQSHLKLLDLLFVIRNLLAVSRYIWYTPEEQSTNQQDIMDFNCEKFPDCPL